MGFDDAFVVEVHEKDDEWICGFSCPAAHEVGFCDSTSIDEDLGA